MREGQLRDKRVWGKDNRETNGYERRTTKKQEGMRVGQQRDKMRYMRHETWDNWETRGYTI